MNRYCLIGLVLGVLAPQYSKAVELKVTIQPISLTGFIEFKAESKQKGEQATRHIIDYGRKEYRWNMGSSDQCIWVWWDTLQGTVYLKLECDGCVLFEGQCSHVGTGEVKMRATCPQPTIYKVSAPGPYLSEHKCECRGASENKVSWIRFK